MSRTVTTTATWEPERGAPKPQDPAYDPETERATLLSTIARFEPDGTRKVVWTWLVVDKAIP